MMFRTQRNYEIKMPLPAELFGEDSGTQHWRAFEIVLNSFWFVGEFLIAGGEKSGDDDFALWHTFATHDVNDLIVQASHEAVREHRLNVVIPPQYNDAGCLSMMPVTEIYQGLEGEHDQPVMIYVTSDGKRYVNSMLESKESDIREKNVIYAKASIDVR